MTTVRELLSRVRFTVDRNSLARVESSFRRVDGLARNLRTRMTSSFSGMFQPLSNEMRDLSASMTSLGSSLMTRLTLPILAFGGFAVKAANDFEESMNRVRAVTGATELQFESLNKKAKELGASTVFSASEVAKGMAFLGQAGLDTEQVLGSIESALQLAAAGQLDLASAADISTNILTQYRLEVEDLSMVNNVLAKTASSTNTNITELGEAFAYAGGIAKNAGLSVKETSQFLGAFANIGVKASRAGTALATGLSRLQGAASGTSRTAKIVNESLSEYGINLQDFQSKAGEIDLAGFLKQLSKFSDRADFTGRVMRVFGEEAGRSFVSLASDSNVLDDVIKKTDNFTDAAANMEKIMMSGLPGAIKVLKSSFESLQLAFVESIKPVLIPLINALSKLFQGFTKLQPETQKFISTILMLSAVVAPLLLTMGFLIPLLSNIVAGFKAVRAAIIATQLSTVLLPIAVIAAIAMIIVAIEDLYAFIKGRPSITGELIRQSGGDVEKVRFFVTEITGMFSDLFRNIANGWKLLFDGSLFNSVLQMFDGLMIRITNTFDKTIQKIKDGIASINIVPDFISDIKLPELKVPGFVSNLMGGDQEVATSAGNLNNISNNASNRMNSNVTVNVSNTNASPEQIGQAVKEAIEPSLEKTARTLRQNSESVYDN